MALALGELSHPGWVVRLAAALARLTGWRRALVAIGLGAAAAGALPPVDAVPLLLIAFTGLVWLADGARDARRPLRAAFGLGWWFGLGFFTAGLYWIAAALFVDIARFWWLLPFAVLGLPAFFGLFTGAVLAGYALLRPVGVARPLALATLWCAAELVRGHLLTGFPWNLIGSAWTEIGPVLQACSVIGVYGLSWLTIAWAALPAALAAPADDSASGGWHKARGGIAALAAGLAVLAAIAAAGALRLAAAPAPGSADADQPGIRLRLVQPNIEQSLKWRDSERAAIFGTLIRLSATPAEPPPTAIIWPEAATPFLFEQSREAREAAAAMLPPDGLLITGTPRATPRPDGGYDYWNGLVALDHADTVRGTYDKFHLVPFGEYVPLHQWLPIQKIAPGGGAGFSAGPGPRTLRLPGLPPVSPLICYEVIFPGQVIDPDDRPAWLLNVTNDAWYGDSSGPYQHFASARTRAVEQGLPLARAANTGISGVVDPYGRVIARLGLGRAGVVDAPLPRALAEAPPYQRWGGWFMAGLLALGLAATGLSRARTAHR
jgi:apolipoprotein N-acyltransferase